MGILNRDDAERYDFSKKELANMSNHDKQRGQLRYYCRYRYFYKSVSGKIF